MNENVDHKEENGAGEFEIARLITECLGRYDTIPKCNVDEGSQLPCDMGGTDKAIDFENYNVDVPDMTELLEEFQIPFYKGCNTSRLVATLLFLNCFVIFGVSTAFADEMLKLVKELLPRENTLPKSHYEAQKYMAKMGLSYNSIHACKNQCCLFRKELKDAKKCPKCDEPRYTSESSTQLVKVLRHFSLIPHLKRMFRCTRLAEQNKWHARRKNEGNNVECVSNSKAWKHIDSLYPDSTSEDRNIRLGMVLDGVNRFSNQALSHSTWPVVLLNYNLPPWQVTKRFFIMLILLIPGKESVTAKNVDIYLAPLVEELL
jgi:hypothetical protein